MRKAAGLVVLITLLLSPQRAFALFQFRDGWTKLMLTPHNGSSSAIPQIITDAGGTILYDYGAFILVNVPVEQQATVTSRLAPLSVSVQSSLEERIFLGGAPIDPRVGIPANIDPSQKTFSYPPGRQGLYVVQLIGPIASQWVAGIEALGSTVAVYVHENAYLVAATPEQARHIVDLPYVQFVDFLHPFEKRADFSKLQTSVRYDLYVGAVATATDSVDADIRSIVETVNSRYGSTDVAYLVRVKGEDAARLARLPLVYNFELQRVSLPHVWATMPRHGGPGSTIIISGEGFTAGAAVTFGGVPSPQVEVLGYDRLRVQVPQTTAAGPVDLLVSVSADHKQFLSGGSASGFHNDSPSRRTFQAGDLIEANTLFNPSFEGTAGGEMLWLDPQDVSLFVRRRFTPLGALLPDANTVFIDPKGNVIYVDNDAATQYDFMSETSSAGPSFAAGATAVLFDRGGDAIVVRGNRIERRAPNGSVTRNGSLAVTVNAADLAADQCTLVYTSGKTIGAIDVCTFQPLPAVFTGTKDLLSVRILPDGTLLAGDATNTRVISMSGSVLATIAGGGMALALSPDGSLAWIAGNDGIRHYDLHSGVVSAPEGLFTGAANTALAVYGGWSAARGAATYLPPARHRAAGH
jgi:hypothetical protein